MGELLWELFEETGDPCVYLLFKAGEQQPERDAATKKLQTQPRAATPSLF